ncbi:hypothetical protein [Niabella hibiscisoli]|uniref:hypothetical protein n=1 Tax=Niabella hibiscisoli TaxID=1825928 RepID=UPI001F0E81B7|nr:hypothetical protein [Niabella hibiscisoli]MCH5718191.1 hypothetical protein [Niabella hibiscisoli]
MKKQIVAAFLLLGVIVCQAQTSIYESNGNVGIGTSTPLAKLDVLGGIDMAPSYPIRLVRGDGNHGLRYKAQYDATTTLDGPFLFGFYGGSLGIKQGEIEQHFINWNSVGNVGIGTVNPENAEGWHKVLEVKSANNAKSLVSSENVISGLWSHEWGFYGAPAGGISGTYTNHPFSFMTNKISRMTITNDGRVGIGTSAPPSNYKLAVAGNIIAEQVRVQLQSSGWPDYVFKPGYKLMPIKDIETFIEQKGHLPEVPSAEQVGREGVELGSNQALLLKKIEEMTLHLISIHKRVESLEEENLLLKKRLEKSAVQ